MLPAGEPRIELLEPSGPDSPIARFSKSAAPDCITWPCRSRTSHAAVERLRGLGRPPARTSRAPGAGGHLYVFVHPASTGGVLLELIQES